MPFTAACPNCRSAKFRVPWKKRDESMACPKCSREFVLLPHDEPPPPNLAPSRFVDTVPTTVAETKPLIPIDADEPKKEGLDVPLVVALSALVLTGLAVVVAYFPYGRFIGAALAPWGVIAAILSLVSLDRKRWLGWSGIVSNSLVGLVLVCFPVLIGVGTWLPPADPNENMDQVYALSKDGQSRLPSTIVDAYQAAWVQNDVRIDVLSARISPLDPAAKSPDQRKVKAMRIALQISNIGVARGLEFKPPTDPKMDIKLTSASGQVLTKKKVEIATPVASVFPGKSTEQTIVFDPPTDLNGSLKLEIPAGWFGQKDAATLSIPAAMIAKK